MFVAGDLAALTPVRTTLPTTRGPAGGSAHGLRVCLDQQDKSESGVMMKEEVALVRKSEMLELLGIGDWTLRQWLERQGFPAPVYVTDGAPARWRLAQVRRWIDGRAICDVNRRGEALPLQ